jgi:hypothetical protein
VLYVLPLKVMSIQQFICNPKLETVNSTFALVRTYGDDLVMILATLNKTLKVEFEWTNDDWEYKILNSGIVTDERWQGNSKALKFFPQQLF